jgi:hypothetical protein
MPPDNRGQIGVENSVLTDYHVVVSRSDDPGIWQWEIHRRSQQLGVRLYGTGFVSRAGANTALKTLLREMAKTGGRHG